MYFSDSGQRLLKIKCRHAGSRMRIQMSAEDFRCHVPRCKRKRRGGVRWDMQGQRTQLRGDAGAVCAWAERGLITGFRIYYKENSGRDPNCISRFQRGPSFFQRWWEPIWAHIPGSQPAGWNGACLLVSGQKWFNILCGFLIFKNNFLPASVFVTFSPRLLSVIFGAFFPSLTYEDIHPAWGDHQ